MCRYFRYLHNFAGMSPCVGIVGTMCWYVYVLFGLPTTIPTHTDTCLPMVTCLHIDAVTECHYVVGIFSQYLQILHLFFQYLHIPTDRFT